MRNRYGSWPRYRRCIGIPDRYGAFLLMMQRMERIAETSGWSRGPSGGRSCPAEDVVPTCESNCDGCGN